MSRATDDMLQDYLDGRLTEEQRTKFETLLEGDAELAGKVEAYLEQGRALREDGPELSPGFYTRARARFEEAHPAGKRGLYRLFSWEVAGLAAAAALAGILFAPGLVQWSGKGEPFKDAKPVVEDKIQAAKPDVTEPPLGLADDLAPTEQAEGGWEAATDEELKQEVLEKEAPPKKEAPRAQPTYADAPAEAAPTPAATREKKGSRGVRLEAMGAADAYAPAPPERMQLPPGAVEPGEWIIIETEAQWLNIPALATLPYDPRFRWVLLGAQPAILDCAEIEIRIMTDNYNILLSPPPAPPDRAVEGGCAIPLPRDGRTITLATVFDLRP